MGDLINALAVVVATWLTILGCTVAFLGWGWFADADADDADADESR